MIEIENINKAYRIGTRTLPVLRDVSLKIKAGTMVALVGESGGGKSTLTKLLPRFHDPTSGTVLWDGIDIRDATISSLRGQIALVTQGAMNSLNPVKRIREQIALGLRDHGAALRDRAFDRFLSELLEKVLNGVVADRNGTIESMQQTLRELADSLERRP